MKALRAHFGGYTSLWVDTQGRAPVYSRGSKYFLLEAPPREIPSSEARSPPPAPPIPAVFQRADFGRCDRFAWPAGACAIDHKAQLMFWGERFAMWVEGDTHVIVDATRPTIAQVTLPKLDTYREVLTTAGKLVMRSWDDVLVFDIAELEGLVAGPGGPFTLELAEVYPGRRPDHTEEVRVERLGDTVTGLQLGKKKQITFPHVPGIVFPMTVTMRDEISEDVFAEVLVPGRDWQVLHRLAATTTIEATCTLRDPVDPAGGLVRSAAPVRQADLDRLFADRADNPDDEATRLVLLDSLEDAGEPYAAQLAALVSKDATTATERAQVLGTLASYLQLIEYRGGLPYAAQLASTAPNDEEIGDIVASDQRLGLFHTLRIGDGSYKIYAKLVSSPRAVGLRHIDVSRVSVVQALIAANRRGLKRLSGVKFATREMIDGLAHPTFDGVEEIEVETAPATVAKLLEFITRDETKFFARRPRHLLLASKLHEEALVPEVLKAWERLPVAKLTVAGRTLERH